MINHFRVSGTLARRLEELGVPPAAVLRRAELPAELFEESKIWVTTEEFFALHSAIHQVSGYSPTAIAALYSRSFRDALTRIARYKRLTCPEDVRLVERGRECSVEFVWLLAEKAEPRTMIDMCFAWVLSIGHRGTGRRIIPSRVELQRPAANRRLYENHFGSPVKFGARHDKMFLSVEDIRAGSSHIIPNCSRWSRRNLKRSWRDSSPIRHFASD